MSQGYEQFFKNAKSAAQGVPPTRTAPKPKVAAAEKGFSLPKKKKAKPFPMGAFFLSIIGFAVAFYGYQNHERLSVLLSRIEISFFGAVHAKTEPTTSVETQKAESVEPTRPVMAEPTGEELNHLVKLVDRKKELDAREEELSRMEAELTQQKEDLQKKIAELERMRASISSILEEKVKADDQKIETLVQFYSNMKPPQAAKIFETLDEDLAVQIIGRMKKKNAADVLNLMKPEKAQLFTEKYAGYKRTTASTTKTDSKDEKPTQAEPEEMAKP